MAKTFKLFQKGIVLKPICTGPNASCCNPTDNIEGSVWIICNDIRTYLNSAVRTLLTDSGCQTLTNKTITIDDDRFTVQDNCDCTKTMQFELSGITTCTARTLTIPDKSLTVAGIACESFTGVTNFAKDACCVSIITTGNVTIGGNLTVQGCCTTVNTAVLDVEDKNITVNKGGSDCTAQGAGLTVERAGTDGSLVYDSALTSKFKLGDVCAESEVIVSAGAQTITGKTIAGCTTNSGTISGGTISAVITDLSCGELTLPSQPTACIPTCVCNEGELFYSTDDNAIFYHDGTNVVELGGAGSSFQVTQACHGLSVRNAIHHDGCNWVKSTANCSTTLPTYVISVVDGPCCNRFTAHKFGRICEPCHGLTVGQYYFNSSSCAGAITLCEPTFGYSAPILYVESATTWHALVHRPSLIACGIASDSEIGSIVAFGLPIGCEPTGFLAADGSSVLRTDYPELFTAIGTAYGAADATHFNLPCVQGKFMRGQDNGAGNDPCAACRTTQSTGGNSGDNVGSIQGCAICCHAHADTFSTTCSGCHAHAWGGTARLINHGGSDTVYKNGSTSSSTSCSGAHTHTINGCVTTVTGACVGETRPLNVSVNYFIRYSARGAIAAECTLYTTFVRKSFPDFIDACDISVPNTTIQNRAPIRDITSDLSARMGVNRIMTQQIEKLQGEFGACGEPVYRATNDDLCQIRFVGDWEAENSTHGPLALIPDITCPSDAVEITYYGTGLNLLAYASCVTKNLNLTVDGSALACCDVVVGGKSLVLSGRNYTQNAVFPVVCGQTLGIHTVKLSGCACNTASNSLRLAGFEILNESSCINVRPGTVFLDGISRSLTCAVCVDYNSCFESGTLGTKGGRVLLYAEKNTAGNLTMKKAVTPTDACQANLACVDHSNEEIVRTYQFREFGAGRSDDFSTLSSSIVDRAFTLDDGTTTLVGNCVDVDSNESLAINTSGTGFLTFTFVGTGLDISWASSGTGTNTNADSFEVFIDGCSVGNWCTVSVDAIVKTKSIVSGLPYGTHSVKIFRNTPTVWTIGIKDFTVYGPSKPTLPANSVEIGEYYIMADFAQISTGGAEEVSAGVLRKDSTREFTLIQGTGGSQDWSLDLTTAKVGGYLLNSNRNNAEIQYTFFGTGFDMRFSEATNRSSNILVQIDSLDANSTNFAGATFNYVGGEGSYNSSTAILDQDHSSTAVEGNSFAISNLPLGLHIVSFKNQTASSFLVIDAIDIITPIHSPKDIGNFALQATREIGSQALSDSRVFEPVESCHVNVTHTIQVATEDNTQTNIEEPSGHQRAVITTSGKPVEVSANITMSQSTSTGTMKISLYIDGVKMIDTVQANSSGAGATDVLGFNRIIPVSAGTHLIQVFYEGSAGTKTISSGGKSMLSVKELL